MKNLLTILITIIVLSAFSYNLPSTGNNSITVCSGTLYDNGGSSNYSNDCSGYTVIYPTSGNAIKLTGTYSLESQFDYVLVYSGVGTGGTLLGAFTGSGTIPTINSIAIDEPLTVKLYSDGNTTESGFVFTIECTTSPGNSENPIAGDNCSNPSHMCNLDGYTGSTADFYTVDKPGNMCDECGLFDGSLENNSWITFTAMATTVSLQINIGNCREDDGIQFAIYSGNNCDGFSILSDLAYTSGSTGRIGTYNFSASGLTVGNTYYFMADGFNGDVCDYELTVISGIMDGSISGPTEVSCTPCTYVINSNATGFTWSGLTGTTFTGQNTNTITVTDWGTLNSANISCISEAGACIGNTAELFVNISPPVNITGASTICSGTNTTLTQSGVDNYWFSNNCASLWDEKWNSQPYGLVNTNLNSVDGILNVTSSSNDGMIDMSGLGSFDPNIYRYIQIRYKVTSGTAGTAEIFFYNSSHNNATGGESAVGTLISDGNWNTLNIDMWDDPDYLTGGNIKGWRYDWCSANGVTMEIDYISLSSSIPIGYGTSINVSPTVTTDYYVFSEENCPCASATITISPDLDGGIIAEDHSVCYNTDPSLFTNTTSPTGGQGAWTYGWEYQESCSGSWLPIASTNNLTFDDATNLTTNRCYRRSATNSCGTIYSNTTTVSVNALPSISAGNNSELCLGQTTAQLNASSAETGSYSWSPSTNLNDPNISNPIATPTTSTTYTVSFTDNNNCTNSSSVLVTVHELPTAIAISDLEICNGDTIDIDASTSTAVNPANITGYEWNNSVNTASQEVHPDLTTTYTVTVTDNFGCQHADNVTITVNQLPSFILPMTIVDVTNCTNPNGELTVQGQDGLAPYTYNIEGGTFSSNNYFDNLNSIIYVLGVKDNKGCENYENVAIPNSSGLSITDVTFDPILCFNDTTSSITITTSSSNVNYSIDNGTNLSNSNIFINNGAGDYAIYVIDNGTNCTASQSLTISQPEILSNLFTTYNIACFGDTSGSALATVSGGTSPYSLLWSTSETTDSIAELIADSTYYLSITDENGCVLTDSIKLTEPNKLQIDSVFTQNLLCFGDANGIIRIGTTGGVEPYVFNWNSSATTDSSIMFLSGGSYYYTVTDFNNCTLIDSAQIFEPELLNLDPFYTNAICANNNGIAGVTVTGGTIDYSFSWSHDASLDNDTASNLSAGNYNITVEDANACSASVNFIIENQSTGSTEILASPFILCYGDSLGQIVAGISGGTPNYNYKWSKESIILRDTIGNNLTDTLNNVSAGVYLLEITDSLGCISTSSNIVVNQPDSIIVKYNSVSISCFGDNNGQINTNIMGGTLPYSYLWSDNVDNSQLNNDTLKNLSAGTYMLTLSDFNNCINSSLTVIINEPSELKIDSKTINMPLCYNQENGSIELNISGGTPEYSYYWSNNTTNLNINNIGAGNYTLSLSDANHCLKVESFILNQANPIGITDTIMIVNYLGTIDITAFGGTPNYTYYWSNGETSQDIENLGTGIYSVEVTDENNCNFNQVFEIEIPLLIPSVITPNDDYKNDTWKISGISKYPKVDIQIYNRWGDLVYNYQGSGIEYFSQQWDGIWEGKELPFGTYVYVIDLNNDLEPYKGTITIVR